MNPTLRFVLWLAAAVCFCLAALGHLTDRNLVAAGLLFGALVFLIDAAEALN